MREENGFSSGSILMSFLLGGLVGALAFHAVTMAVGAFLFGKAAKGKQAA